MRFGLVHVDYDTQVRTLKNSSKYFALTAEKFGFAPRIRNAEGKYVSKKQ